MFMKKNLKFYVSAAVFVLIILIAFAKNQTLGSLTFLHGIIDADFNEPKEEISLEPSLIFNDVIFRYYNFDDDFIADSRSISERIINEY